MNARPPCRPLLALALVAWLNLMVQPCLAFAPAMPAGMEHCGHGTQPAEPAPCPEMTADDCVVVHDFHADGPRASEPPRGTLITLLPPDPSHHGLRLARHLAADTGGPALIILYGHLRN